MRSEVEFTAEEEDSGAVIFEAAEATSVGLERLDLGVETLGEGVGDTMREVGQQTAEMGLEGLRHLFDLGQTTAHHAAIPLLEELVAGRGIGLVPELDHLLFIGPGAGGAQIDFQEGGEIVLTILRHRAMQPQETCVLERVVALGRELGAFHIVYAAPAREEPAAKEQQAK